jgi:hypothetical protein
MTNIASIPFLPVFSLPCAMLPKSFPNVVCHNHSSNVAGSCMSFLSLEIVSLVTGCIIRHAICSYWSGSFSAHSTMRLREVKIQCSASPSDTVNALIACWVTKRCWACVGILDRICSGSLSLLGGMAHGKRGTGNIPGVLLCVMQWWMQGQGWVFLRACFALGFHDSIIAGALVSHVIVIKGASSITLYSQRPFCWCPPFVVPGGKVDSRYYLSKCVIIAEVSFPLWLFLQVWCIPIICPWVHACVGVQSCPAICNVGGRFCRPRNMVSSCFCNVKKIASIVVHWQAKEPSSNAPRCPRHTHITVLKYYCFAS